MPYGPPPAHRRSCPGRRLRWSEPLPSPRLSSLVQHQAPGTLGPGPSVLAKQKWPSRKAYHILGTTRVEEGVPKRPDVLLHRPERPVEVQVLQEGARIVTFRVGAHQLLQALQPVAY